MFKTLKSDFDKWRSKRSSSVAPTEDNVLEIERGPPAPVIGSLIPMDSTYNRDQIPKPVKSQLKLRRGGIRSGPNRGHAKLVVPILFVNGESLCELQDVIFAINATDGNEIGETHRGYDGFMKVKNIIPKLGFSLFAEFSVGNFSFVDKEHPDDGTTWDLISSLSSLCTFPLIIMKIFKKVNLPAKFEYAKKDPLLLTFALRNVLARLAFHTKLQSKIRVTLRKEMKDNGYELSRPDEITTDAISTFVGFNRLLSPNNNTGVSYSSDLDYKLIIDCRELLNGNGEPLSKEQVKDLVKKLNEAQEAEDVKGTFDGDAKMLLEVEDFTTRDFAELEGYLKPARVNDDALNTEREKNFLASIYRNNIHIAGSGSVYSDFQKLLDDCEKSNGLEVAKRTWIQYLGPSDKGSAMWISKAAELKVFFGSVSELIISNLDENVESRINLKQKLLKQKDIRDNKDEKEKVSTAFASSSWKQWLHSPKVLKVVLKIDILSNIILESASIKDGLDSLKMFDKKLVPLKEQLSIAIKVFAGLVDDGVYEPTAADKCLKHIGSTLSTNEDWRFSLKYAGCRLNDFYDSVLLEDYKKWCAGMNESEVEDRYYIGKAIASVINEFALRMQNFIYLLAAIPDSRFQESTGKSHEDIDALYSRMTKDRFIEMIIRSATSNEKATGNVDIEKALNTLKNDIDLKRLFYKAKYVFDFEISTSYPRSLNESIQKVQLEIENLLSAIDSDQNEANGKALFDSIFDLVIKTSNFLKPPPTFA